MKKSKSERKRDREILAAYQRYLTEKELEPLFERFKEWKANDLSYDDLTEFIHEFHKKNQKIWGIFNNSLDEEYLIFHAKKELNMFNEKDLDKELYKLWLNL